MLFNKKCDSIFIKEFYLIFTSSISVLALQWAVFSTFSEIDNFDKTLRSELEEFETYFNLSSELFMNELPQFHRRKVGKRYAFPYGTLRDTYLQSGSLPDCPPGLPGWSGVPGFDGVPGPDGPPGLDGIPGDFANHERYGVPPALSCTMCPEGPPGRPGDTGPDGPRGPPGTAGPPAPTAYGNSAPGPRGQPGDSGRAGRDGDPGRPGSNGATGITCYPGAPGRRGAPGPSGQPGQPGETRPRAERGLPGPRGIPGMEGRTGKAGASGRNGQTGLRGRNGDDGLYCPCPKRTPKSSYYTVLPNSVPWEDPANALTDRLARRAAASRFPKPPLFPMKPVEGDVVAQSDEEVVEDISRELSSSSISPATDDSLTRSKWADVMERRRKRWQQRAAGSSPTLRAEASDQQTRERTTMMEHLPTAATVLPRFRELQGGADTVDGEVVLSGIDAAPRRLAWLQLGKASGSLRLPDEVDERPAC